MLYYMLYSEGLDAIARHYIRQQAELDRLCDGYSGHLQDWAARREAVAVIGYTDRVQL